MRIAVLILGLALGLLMFIQTVLGYMASGLADNQETGGAAAVGILMAFLWLLAVALVFPVPLVSAIVFAIAGILGFGASTNFPDLAIWGGASFVLAALSVLAWFGKRKAVRQERERDARLAASIRESVSTSPLQPVSSRATTVSCDNCGTTISASSRFCQECGAARPDSGGTLPAANT
jgi:hypothetical protein